MGVLDTMKKIFKPGQTKKTAALLLLLLHVDSLSKFD